MIRHLAAAALEADISSYDRGALSNVKRFYFQRTKAVFPYELQSASHVLVWHPSDREVENV
jgi:hypothetical protein